MSPVESFDHAVHSRPKRKLDDYAPNLDGDDDDAETSDLVSVRMRKDEPNAVHQSSDLSGPIVSDAAATSSAESRTTTRSRLQFFIRMLSEGNTIVIQANSNDTVKSIHERIQVMTGIPVMEQRLIYRGKQLQWEQSLAECSIQNDAGLQLVGRMRSTEHPQAWQVIDDMVGVICRLCKGELVQSSLKLIKSRMTEFFAMTPKDDNDLAIGYLQIFMYSSAPAALVMLYMSPMSGNKECADSSIRHFLNSCRNALPKNLHTQCAPIVLEFCKLLRKFTPEDTLYLACRSTLGSLLENFGGSLWEKIGVLRATKYGDDVKGLVVIQDIFPFVSELAGRLSRDLTSSMEMVLSVGPLVSDVRDFTAFLVPLRKAILGQVGITCPIAVPLPKRGYNHPSHGDEIEYLHGIFRDLLMRMDKCLGKVEERLNVRGSGDGEINYSGWSQYAKRSDDHRWLLEHKDVTNFESRRHLVMMMLPEVKEDYEELFEMLIDRSHLLAESFEYIGRADPEALHGGLFMEFKNEEATGPGVLREWFFLVCQALFNQQNALFVACPNDRRRFYPNPGKLPLAFDACFP
ncbi:hypothetical protein Patl1_09785 [Pistacia atlantica]|uniref:Uncharacterized protein n=1 Tax=Pistacia atlantica TaxID=434234 RepID=A0ACC1A8N8_9ROSI|nr:hypothetical protein Patl1_09785 [Pistacia atlantica]